MFDVRSYNRRAWDAEVAKRNRWTVPVSEAEVAAARAGEWSVVLTPTRPVPRAWFPASLRGVRLLGLASAGGQQGPILAAAGAEVTVFDNSPAQLARDREVAAREGLALRTVEGDMRDLSAFADGAFDLVFHPCSNCFVEHIQPVWREAFRVLRPGGALLSGFCNPVLYLVDRDAEARGVVTLKFAAPFSDLVSLDERERAQRLASGEPLEFGHTLEEQLGGQLSAGFMLTAMYEDRFEDGLLDRYLPCFIATRAVKPDGGERPLA